MGKKKVLVSYGVDIDAVRATASDCISELTSAGRWMAWLIWRGRLYERHQ